MIRGLPRLYDSADDLAFDEDEDISCAETQPGPLGCPQDPGSGIRSFFASLVDELEGEFEDTKPFVWIGVRR